MAAPGTGGDERCEALGEGPPGTIGRATEEAASVDHEGDGATAAGKIGNAALIPAVDCPRGTMAEWATCCSGNRLGDEGEMIALGAHMHDAHSTPVREESGKTHGETSFAMRPATRRSVKGYDRFTPFAEDPVCSG